MTTTKPIFRMSESGKAVRSSPEWKEKIRQGVVHYWNSLTTEERARIIDRQNQGKKGHSWSEEQRLALSIKNTGEGNPLYGKKHSSETKQQMSSSQKVSCFSSSANFANLSPKELVSILGKATEARKLKGISEESRAKWRKTSSGVNNGFYGKHHTKEAIEKVRLARKQATARGEKYGFAAMSKEQLQEINRRSIAKSCAKPNQAEAKLMELINEACPNQYKYTGDASVKIAGLYPDFFNVNGKKKVIELFGDYYHSEQVIQSKDWRATELGRIMAYNSYGFDCLII